MFEKNFSLSLADTGWHLTLETEKNGDKLIELIELFGISNLELTQTEIILLDMGR